MIKFGFHAAAVLYTGGSIAQLLRLIYDFPLQELPYLVDWMIVILGSIGATTLTAQTRNIVYRGRWEKPTHFLIIAHLIISIALHLWAIYIHNHDVFLVFPLEYSYFAILYFVFFAWRSWTIMVSNSNNARDV